MNAIVQREIDLSSGAGIVEGYPTEFTMEHTPDPFVWTGTTTAFKKQCLKKFCGAQSRDRSCVSQFSKSIAALRINFIIT